MNTITLYDHPASIHAQYARICLDEAGVEYEKQFVDLPLGNLKPSFAQISPALSVPALEIKLPGADGTTQSTKLIDSREIINYCKDVEGGKRLFPEDKLKDINEILDLVYAANGGQISFKAYPPRDPIFNFAINKIMAPLRGYKVRGYLANSRHSPRLTKAYQDALVRLDRPGPSMEELSGRANDTMSVLDERLKEGPWLLGAERTAADLVAAVWVQWIVWANVPSIAVPPRVLDFLERSKETPSWKKCRPEWVIPFVRFRIYVGTIVLGCAAVGVACLVAKKASS
ncbi:hypothetical protein ACHAXT_000749 [Thalassiosira profunda]